MREFNCPHCNALIAASDVPPEVAASAFGLRKSAAKTAAAKANSKLTRTTNQDNPDGRTKPEPQAPDGPVAEPSALRKAGELVTTLAGAKALELKPLETNKVRDYSGVYS
jgi:hypothetical protein